MKIDSRKHSPEERMEVAMLLLKDLNPLLDEAGKMGFGLLSYLLRMSILEAQSIASAPLCADRASRNGI